MNTQASEQERIQNYCLKRAPEYLRSMYYAAAQGQLIMGLVVPYGEAFDFTADKPMLVSISDDIGRSYGPNGFNQATLVPLIKQSGAAVIVSVYPQPVFYDEIVQFCLGNNVHGIIIETAPGREMEWLKYLVEVNPYLRWALWAEQQMGVG